MVSANVASQLYPYGDMAYTPGTWPVFQGFVTHPTLPSTSLAPYARLWRGEEQLWIRPMVPIAGADAGWFRYTSIGTGATETKRITFGSGVSGGYWALGHHDVATDWIAWGDSNEGIVQRIGAHPDFHPWQLSLVYNPAGKYLDITFIVNKAGMNIDDITVLNRLTGVGDLNVTITTPSSGTGDFSVHDGGRGQYGWDIVTWDGSTWTGGSWGQRYALAPARAMFWIDSAPTVSMTQPLASTVVAEVDIAHTQPNFIWTIGAMDYAYITRQELVIKDYVSKQVVPIEGKPSWITGDQSIRSYELPFGIMHTNGNKYDWIFTVTKQSGKSTTLTGRVEIQQFLPPKPTNLTPTWGYTEDGGPRYISLSYTFTPDDLFLDVVFRMRRAGVVPRSPKDIVLGYRSDPTVRSVNIIEYPLNLDMILSVSHRAMRNGKIVEGPAAEYAFNAKWDGIMLTEVYSYTIRTLSLPYHRGRGVKGAESPDYADVLNRAAPVAVHSGVGKSYVGELTAVFPGPFPGVARAKIDLIKEMYENEGKQTLLYRDTMGEMFYMQINEPDIRVSGGGMPIEVGISFTQIARDELLLPTGPA